MLKRIYKKLPRPSISRDFILIISSFTLLMLSLAIWFSFKIYKDQESKNSILLNSSARKIERVINDDFGYVEYQMRYINNQIKEKGSNPNFVGKLLGTFDMNIKSNAAITWNMFSWVNREGFLTVDGAKGILAKPVDLRSRDYLSETAGNPDKMYIGDPVYGAVTSQLLIPAGMGAFDTNNKYVGSIVFGFNINNLIYKLEQVNGNMGVNFLVLSKQNKIILKSSDSKLTQDEIDYLITENKKNFISRQNIFDKNNSLTILHNLDRHNLKIVVQYNHHLAHIQFWSKWIFYMAQLAIITLVLIFLLFLLRIKILSPIINLSKIADSISKGDVRIKIPHYKSLEAETLAESLTNIKEFIEREEKLKQEISHAERIANHANAAKLSLMRSISHDIRNYVFKISDLSELLIKEESEKPIKNNNSLKNLELINSESKEFLLFVEDLLDKNQSKTGKFSLGYQTKCNIAEMIRNIAHLNKVFLSKQQINLELEIEENLPLLLCDPRRFKQIISNLLSNSIKYNNQNGFIKIIAKHSLKNKQIIIEIIDSGIGMNEDEIEMALSGKGEEINKSGLNKKIDSHGIGLPIVKHLTELHGAKFEIESKKNIGSTFRLTFPINSDVREESLGFEVVKKINILIVDDQKTNLISTKYKIENILYYISCDIAHSGKEAIKMAKENEYHLILMDVQMPGIGGIEATKEIRLFNQETPIIALTSLDYKQFLEEASPPSSDHEFSYYLNKSAPENTFYRAITKWITDFEDNLFYLGRKEEYLKILPDKKILLADDQDLNRMLITKQLQSFGSVVTGVSNGQELVEAYQNNLDEDNQSKFDLIITDINMDPHHGDVAAQKIRKIESDNNIPYYNRIPIIALSGNGGRKDIHHYFKCQITDYFIKGNNSELLTKIIANSLIKKDINKNGWENESNYLQEEIENSDLSPAILNLKKLDGFSIKGREISSFLELFLHDSLKIMSLIRKNILDNNLTELSFNIHAFKGISNNIGAEKLFDLVTKIEIVLKNNQLPDHDWLQDLENHHQELIKKINNISEKKSYNTN